MLHNLPIIILWISSGRFLPPVGAFLGSFKHVNPTSFSTITKIIAKDVVSNRFQMKPGQFAQHHVPSFRTGTSLLHESNIDLDVNEVDVKKEKSDSSPGKATNLKSHTKRKGAEPKPDPIDLNAVCRLVANGDGKLPNFRSLSYLKNDPQTLAFYEQMNAYYHAKSHKETSAIKYLQRSNHIVNSNVRNPDNDQEYISSDGSSDQEENQLYRSQMTSSYEYNYEEEKELVSTLKSCLEGAGFELLSRRDLDLCQALNVGYLLRLSIVPKIKNLDPIVGEEFYPDLVAADLEYEDEYDDFYENGIDKDDDPLLFDGRVLVFRRGYSEEISRGRLLLQKLDYLQTSLVQKSASTVADAITAFQTDVTSKVTKSSDSIKKSSRESLYKAADSITKKKMSNYLQKSLIVDDENFNSKKRRKRKKNKKIQLARYGGSKIKFLGASDLSDTLTPFLLCEIDDSDSIIENNNDKGVNDQNMTNSSEIILPISLLDENVSKENKILYAGLESGKVGCNYDTMYSSMQSTTKSSFQLLERVSISNVVDFFSKEGRQRLIKSFISKSELVEPTYEEVVVVWRQLPDKKINRPKFRIPSAVYDIAEIFEVEDRLPPKPLTPNEPPPQPLQIRIFNEVPMANLPAVLPETQLIFRPADAFLFDMVSVLTLLAVLATQRYDNPKLDLIALISVGLWLLRTVLRYSNKLARYDLLVNKFLTSKLSLKGAGALNYILSEASKQRATKAGLLHTWLQNVKDTSSTQENKLPRTQVNKSANTGINELLHGDHSTSINIDSVIDDLEDLNLIESTGNGSHINTVYSGPEAMNKLKKKWISLFDSEVSKMELDGKSELKETEARE